ncbi:MAG TPA: hypothetical protein VEB42_05025 [Chitinophagaceae bacterium]|nr:hypothetical protein [Chitinophagaceae bacterium]
MARLYSVYLLLAISIFTASCASIVNGPYTSIKVYTTAPTTIIHNHDTIKTRSNRANLDVKRQDQTLSITAVTDSLTKTFKVEPRNSFMYLYNILSNYGIGMLIDKDNPKRYSYPKRIYINSGDTISKYFRYGQSDNKGELYLHLSLPYINSFQLKPENEGAKLNTGFWGGAIGLDYFYSKDKFISAGFSGVSDFFVPVPAAVDISGEYEVMSSIYFSLSNNHRIKRFTIGYGLSYARNTWSLKYSNSFNPPPPARDPVTKSSNAFGLIFPVYFQLGEHFHLGAVYRPTFYRPNLDDKFSYEHLISIDLAWKLRLGK